MQVRLRVDVVEPFLLGLIREGAHLDTGKFADFVLALGAVAVEWVTRLWPGCELGQGHEAYAIL